MGDVTSYVGARWPRQIQTCLAKTQRHPRRRRAPLRAAPVTAMAQRLKEIQTSAMMIGVQRHMTEPAESSHLRQKIAFTCSRVDTTLC